MSTKLCALPTMSGGSVAIGPIQSPNTAFWPEPPPPYSPPLDPGKFGEFVNTKSAAETGSWRGADSPAKSSHSSTDSTVASSVSPMTTSSSSAGSQDGGGLMSFLPPLPSSTSLSTQVEEITKYYDEFYSSLLNPFEGITSVSVLGHIHTENNAEVHKLTPTDLGKTERARGRDC